MNFWRRLRGKDQSATLGAASDAEEGLGGTAKENFDATDVTRAPSTAKVGFSEAESDSDQDSDDDGAPLGAGVVHTLPSGDEAEEVESEAEGDEDSDDGEADEGEESEEEEEDIETMWERFEANLAGFQPKLKDTRSLIPDHELLLEVHARRNPALSDNARFVMGGTRKPDDLGQIEVPPLIGVTGHKSRGGNIGINGIYELYPGLFHDRPVYQKVLEKRSVQDLMAAPPGGLIAPRDPLFTPRSRLEAKRNQRALIIKAPQKQKGLQTMWPVPNAWFIFFDRGTGCWCIGSAVGHSEIYARCPGAEELVPDGLDRWQVWDAGLHQWYEHRSLCTFKGGNIVK